MMAAANRLVECENYKLIPFELLTAAQRPFENTTSRLILYKTTSTSVGGVQATSRGHTSHAYWWGCFGKQPSHDWTIASAGVHQQATSRDKDTHALVGVLFSKQPPTTGYTASAGVHRKQPPATWLVEVLGARATQNARPGRAVQTVCV